MRTLSNLATALLFVMTALLPTGATAEPIAVSSGSLVTDSSRGRVQIQGQGFQLDAVGTMTGGLHWPAAFCEGTPTDCISGTRFPLTTRWSGSDFTGTATLDGRTFRIGSQTDDTGGAGVDFDGTFVVPFFTGADLSSAFAPFTFTGQLLPPLAFGHSGTGITMSGRGTAQINLRWLTTAGGGWDFDSAVFQFDESAPVPEPATLLLVGTGIAGLVRRRVRRAGAERVRVAPNPASDSGR